MRNYNNYGAVKYVVFRFLILLKLRVNILFQKLQTHSQTRVLFDYIHVQCYNPVYFSEIYIMNDS